MAGTFEQKLAALGVTLPTPVAPLANYVPFTVTGNLVIVSGQGPFEGGKVAFAGKVGETLSVEQGQQAHGSASSTCWHSFGRLVAAISTGCGASFA